MSDPKPLGPIELANSVLEMALAQYKPSEAIVQVTRFLTESLVYTIAVSARGDEAVRKARLKEVGEAIIAAPVHPQAPTK